MVKLKVHKPWIKNYLNLLKIGKESYASFLDISFVKLIFQLTVLPFYKFVRSRFDYRYCVTCKLSTILQVSFEYNVLLNEIHFFFSRPTKVALRYQKISFT